MFPIESAVYILRKHLTWKQIAEAMGVSVRDARKWNGMMGWNSGGVLWRLNMLCNIANLLEDRLGRRGASRWLRAQHSALGNKTPCAVFKEKGGPAKVRAAAKAHVRLSCVVEVSR